MGRRLGGVLAVVIATAAYARPLNSLLCALGLKKTSPTYTTEAAPVTYDFSRVLEGSDGRVYLFTKVKKGTQETDQIFYRSRGDGAFRLLPALITRTDSSGKKRIQNYFKEGGSSTLEPPPEVQVEFHRKTRATKPEFLSAEQIESLLLKSSLPQYEGIEGLKAKGLEDKAKNIPPPPAPILAVKAPVGPGSTEFAGDFITDYRQAPVLTYPVPYAPLGNTAKVEARVYQSKSKKGYVTVYVATYTQGEEAGKSKVWFGTAYTSLGGTGLTDRGIPERPVDTGRLALGLYAYFREVPKGKAGNPAPYFGTEYVSAWNFLRELPEVQKFLSTNPKDALGNPLVPAEEELPPVR